jgi:2',3'-cyclic-nucleotide 2'-phosphodiesterase (5'-nucleotidase family)
MSTTTIRVDKATHAQLLELSEASGATLIETIGQATEALRRQRFAAQVASELAELASDAEAWSAYVGEADVAAVSDGIN